MPKAQKKNEPHLFDVIVSNRVYTIVVVVIIALLVALALYIGTDQRLATFTPGATQVNETADILPASLDPSNYQTFLTAVEVAGLTNALSDANTALTVFIPSDAAFAQVNPNVLGFLLDNPAYLEEVLLYHVLAGEVLASDVVSSTTLATLQGESVSVSSDNSGVSINGNLLGTTDIQDGNFGDTYHQLTGVLVPDSVAAVLPTQDIVEIAQEAGVFTTLISALQATGLDVSLQGDGPYTVFAPTDDAFAAVPTATLNALLDDPALLKKVLLYHVLPVGSNLADLADTNPVTLQGESLDLTAVVNPASDSGYTVNGNTVETANIAATNGRVNIIDGVLLPQEVKDALAGGGGNTQANIVDTAKAAGTFNTLLTALDAANLTSTLKGPGSYTVFAPNDAAFAKLDQDVLNTLLDDTDLLQDVLLYHVVGSELFAEDVLARSTITTLEGETVTVTSNNSGAKINNSLLLATDIDATNGVIHVIDQVLVPASVAAALADNAPGTPNTTTTNAATNSATTGTGGSANIASPTAGVGQVVAIVIAIGLGLVAVIVYVAHMQHMRGRQKTAKK